MPVSERPEGPVSFSTLSSTARVINISPAWPSVAQALTYLRAAPPPLPGPEYDTAVQTVHEFAELLRRNADTIANALLCGTVLGQLTSGRSPATALRTGLITISEAFRFGFRSEEEIRAILARLAEALPRILNIGAIPFSSPGMEGTGGGWVQAVDAMLADVRKQGATVPSGLTEFVQQRLMGRVDSFLVGQAPEDPSPEELVAHVDGEVNSGFLRWDPARMTALQWSRIVAAWVDPDSAGRRPAPWLVAAALAALGFMTEDPIGTATWLNPEVRPVPTDVPRFRRMGPVPERGLLLVRDTTRRTIAERWLPAPEVAALVLPPESAARVINLLVRAKMQPTLDPGLRLIAIEGVHGADRLAELLGRDPYERLQSQFQFSHVLPSEVEADPFTQLWPVIIRPRGFKDLAERMTARLPRK